MKPKTSPPKRIGSCARDFPDVRSEALREREGDLCPLWSCRKGTMICPRKQVPTAADVEVDR